MEMPPKFLEDGNTLPVVNVHTEAVSFEIAESVGVSRRYTLAPGQFMELEEGYVVTESRDGKHVVRTRNSVIENLTGGRVLPADDPRAAHTRKPAADDPGAAQTGKSKAK
jgi:hypothetical protein